MWVHADSKGPDQTVHPDQPVIKAFAVCKQNHWILLNASMESKCLDENAHIWNIYETNYFNQIQIQFISCNMSTATKYSRLSLSRLRLSQTTLISKWKSGLYLNMKIEQQITKNILWKKRRNCSYGAISPLFHNIFNISLTSGVKLHIHLSLHIQCGCSI